MFYVGRSLYFAYHVGIFLSSLEGKYTSLEKDTRVGEMMLIAISVLQLYMGKVLMWKQKIIPSDIASNC